MASSPVSQPSRHRPPAISLVVPVYRGGADFRLCLAGIAKLSPPADEVIVVVDGDDDGSGDATEAAGARLIRLPGRFGPAMARNAGARESSGELLLFMDADTVPATSVVGHVREVFDADPGLAALIGSYDDAPGASSFLSQYRNLLHHSSTRPPKVEPTPSGALAEPSGARCSSASAASTRLTRYRPWRMLNFVYVLLADRHHSEPPPRLMGEANNTPQTHEQ